MIHKLGRLQLSISCLHESYPGQLEYNHTNNDALNQLGNTKKKQIIELLRKIQQILQKNFQYLYLYTTQFLQGR